MKPGFFRTPGGQGLLAAVGLGFSQLAAFIFILVIARQIGLEDVGRIQVVIAFYMLLHVPAKLGLDEALAYLLPRQVHDGRSSRPLIAYSLTVSTIVSAAVAAAVALGAPWIERVLLPIPAIASDLRFMAVVLPVLAVLYVAVYALRGMHRSDLMAACLLYGVPLVTLLLLFPLCLGGLTRWEAYTVRIVALAIPGLLAAMLALRARGNPAPLDGATLRRLHAFSAATLGTSLLQQLLENSAILLGPSLLTERDLGHFVVAAKLWGVAFLCIGPLLFVLGPAMAASLAAGAEERARQLHGAAGRLMLVGTAALFGPMAALRREALGIFGREYVEAAPLLLVLAIGQIAVAATGLNSPALLARGRQRAELWLGAGTLLAVWICSFALAPAWGTLGIAAALLIATGVFNLGRLAVLGPAGRGYARPCTLGAAAACGLASIALLLAERLQAPSTVAAAAFVLVLIMALMPVRRALASDARVLFERPAS